MAEPKQLTISFRRSPDYKIFPATGTWGGPTPNGEILINFVVDHPSFPSYTIHNFNEGKANLNTPSESVSSGEFEKEILCGVLLTPKDAISIAEWLKNVVSAMGAQGGTEGEQHGE